MISLIKLLDNGEKISQSGVQDLRLFFSNIRITETVLVSACTFTKAVTGFM